MYFCAEVKEPVKRGTLVLHKVWLPSFTNSTGVY